MPALTVNAITKRYLTTAALDDVSLGADSGVCGLLGPNGAGKTTLLRIIATTLAPSAGRVSFDGLDPADPQDRVAMRRRLGYVPQEPGFHMSFTAFAFVDYVAILKEYTDRRARHDEVRRVLAAVGLDDVMHKKVRKLSGGMRRRLSVAQAMLGDPDLLVLDEPTVGLDPEQRLRFRAIVSRLAGRSTVMLSTHLTEDVEALCDRVIVLDAGRIRFDGKVTELAAVANDHVWRAALTDDNAAVSWRTGDGHRRHIGNPPPGAELVQPTVEDGYLLLLAEQTQTTAA